jgi:hypothetical protein
VRGGRQREAGGSGRRSRNELVQKKSLPLPSQESSLTKEHLDSGECPAPPLMAVRLQGELIIERLV